MFPVPASQPPHWQPQPSNFSPASQSPHGQPQPSSLSPASQPAYWQPSSHGPQQPTNFSYAPAPEQRQPVSYSEMYQLLGKTERQIKAIRGWHGSRLAVAGGVAGGATVVAAAVGATVATGGVGAIVVGGAVVGGTLVGGGALAGLAKTQFGKRACQRDPQLMRKLALFIWMRDDLKAHKKDITREQRHLYRDLKAVTKKVDGSSLRVAAQMALGAGVGSAAGAASVAILAGAALVAGGDGGGTDCSCWGPGGGAGIGGGGRSSTRRGPPQNPHQPTGFALSPGEIAELEA